MGALTEEDEFFSIAEIRESGRRVLKISNMNLYPFGHKYINVRGVING